MHVGGARLRARDHGCSASPTAPRGTCRCATSPTLPSSDSRERPARAPSSTCATETSGCASTPWNPASELRTIVHVGAALPLTRGSAGKVFLAWAHATTTSPASLADLQPDDAGPAAPPAGHDTTARVGGLDRRTRGGRRLGERARCSMRTAPSSRSSRCRALPTGSASSGDATTLPPVDRGRTRDRGRPRRSADLTTFP